MRKALFLTAYNRPFYLEEALASWKAVRGIYLWDIYVSFEPSDLAEEQAELVRKTFPYHPALEIVIQPQLQGVLHHPWVGFEHLFMERGYDFVVRTEDDLVVSADILEFFDYASAKFQNNAKVATVNAYTREDSSDTEGVALVNRFSPLVWGTWADRWEGMFGPTWDHDYSTNNGTPGVQAGWDWNINTRLFPQHKLLSCTPLSSRVHNIGLVGTHSLPENYETAPSFQADFGRVKHHLVDS